MPIVKMPDGAQVQFPDDMPPAQIKALIVSKFPQLGGPTPQAQQMQSAAKNVGQAPPEGYDSSYLSQGMSGLNEGIAQGLGAPVDVASSLINLGTSGVNALAHTQIPQITDPFLGSGTFRRIMAPTIAPKTGDPGKNFLRRTTQEIGSAMLPSGLGSKVANSGALLASQLGLSALGGLGAATAEHFAPGNTTAELAGELLGMGTGAGAAKLGMRLAQNPEARRLAEALAADNIAPNEIQSRVGSLGPGAVVGDLGPNLQGMTAALATSPGEARNTIVSALGARQASGNARVMQGVENTLGPAPIESQFIAGNRAAKDALSPEYEAAFRAKALSPNFALDAKPIGDAIDNVIQTSVGNTRTQLQRVKRMLLDPQGNYVRDPQMVMAVRKEVDGMIDGEMNTTTKGVLKSLRKSIDTDLGSAVPGLKDVDAKFAELAKQGESFDFGKTLIKGGEGAVDPADLAGAVIQGSSGQGNARAQGLLTSIKRIIGTTANDRQALAKILLGEGSWNREKLAIQFGQDKADELVKLFENERVKAGTENLALANSKTAAVSAAQRVEAGAAKPPGLVRSALNLHAGDAAASLADKLLGTTFQQRRAGQNAKLAQMLMSGAISPETVAKMTRPGVAKALIGPATAMIANQTGAMQ